MITIHRKIELFTEYVYKFQKLLGLLQYRIEIKSNNKEDIRGNFNGNIISGTAFISYNLAWLSEDILEEKIKQTAFHEICELSLLKIRCYLKEYYSENIVNELIHEQIRIMENVYLPLI